ncbi:MAG: hypothetical protein WBC73_21135 [Phormidesmis sp.]
MNAAKRPLTPSAPSTESQPSVHPLPSSRSASRSSDRTRRTPYEGARRAIAFESSVKLTVNLLLAIVATTTIAKLVPYYQSQQQRLSTLQTSVQMAEQKKNELRSQFDRNFDPAQASHIMQEQSGRTYPNQKKVVWSEPSKSEPLESEPLKSN